MKKCRLDQLLLDQGYVDSIEKAQSFIMQGKILVNDKKKFKSGDRVDPESHIRILGETSLYVSRGGDKLAGAIQAFKLDVIDRVALDVGVSTGGFSDYLIQHGVAHCIGIDVGYGQVASKVAQHSRCSVLERTNARTLTSSEFREKLTKLGVSTDIMDAVSLVVMDLSFISVLSVLPSVVELVQKPSDFIILVKPQFESTKDQIEAGGIIRDGDIREEIVESVCHKLLEQGFEITNKCLSPIKGQKGNIEYFVHAKWL